MTSLLGRDGGEGISAMTDTLLTVIGAAAAVSTSLSYFPQVRKAWPRGSTSDLSLKMLAALTVGLVLWFVYGLMRVDYVIVAANSIGAGLSGCVLAFKLRDMRSEKS